MKGIVFNLLEQVVSDEHGDEAWDAILERATLGGAYTAVGNYDDDEFMSLVDAAAGHLDLPKDDVVQWFGRMAIPHFAQRYPAFFAGHETTRSFVLTLNDVIHPEVRKLFPGAYAPTFDFDTSDDDRLGLTYQSHRELCSFAEGLLHGAAQHYGETASIEQASCSKRGDERCHFVVRFEPAR